MSDNKKELSAAQQKEIMEKLQVRFEKNMKRHAGLEWVQVKAKLEAQPGKLWSLNEMEASGGEPDVIGQDGKTGEFIFADCSAETRKGAGTYATTGKRWIPERKPNRATAPWMWQRPWGSNSCRRRNTANCKSWGSSI